MKPQPHRIVGRLRWGGSNQEGLKLYHKLQRAPLAPSEMFPLGLERWGESQNSCHPLHGSQIISIALLLGTFWPCGHHVEQAPFSLPGHVAACGWLSFQEKGDEHFDSILLCFDLRGCFVLAVVLGKQFIN